MAVNFLTRAWGALRRVTGGPAGAPGAGAGRMQWRRFDGARLDRLTAGWQATNQAINQELRGDLDRLRARGRDLALNNDYARKFVQLVQTNVVGPSGIRLQARVEDGPGRPDRLANAAIEAAWLQWQASADLGGRQHLRDLCATLVGALPSDGEFLVRLVRGAEAGNRWNFALQLIDVDRIDTQFNGRHGANLVVMGVELDSYRRPVALHLFSAHPNEAGAGRERMRVPMGDLVHGFKVERGEQVRGIPWMAPGMLSLHHLANFKLSALLAAEHGANHFGFFVSPDGSAPFAGLEGDSQVAVSQPGTYDTLPPGFDFKAYDSKYPETNFGPFVKTTLQRIASGWGVAYHSLANDLEGVSFSSIRSGTLEERDRWMADQEWFIQAFLEPVFTAWLQMALLSGAVTMPNGSALPAAKLDKFGVHEWQARRWDWVDPLADTEANILKVRAGLMAPQDLAAAMGYDFEDVIKSIAQAQALAAEFGVALPAYDALPGASTASAPAAGAAGAGKAGKAAPGAPSMAGPVGLA
jgi:lambda family phage portal protein